MLRTGPREYHHRIPRILLCRLQQFSSKNTPWEVISCTTSFLIFTEVLSCSWLYIIENRRITIRNIVRIIRPTIRILRITMRIIRITIIIIRFLTFCDYVIIQYFESWSLAFIEKWCLPFKSLRAKLSYFDKIIQFLYPAGSYFLIFFLQTDKQLIFI